MAAHWQLCLGALLLMLRRHDARRRRHLRAACGQSGCAWRHCARGPGLRWQLSHARWLLARCAWRHALPCNTFDQLQLLILPHADCCLCIKGLKEHMPATMFSFAHLPSHQWVPTQNSSPESIIGHRIMSTCCCRLGQRIFSRCPRSRASWRP